MKVDALQLCEIYDVDRKTVTNWLNSKPPVPSRMLKGKRQFDTVEVAKWREGNAIEKSGGKKKDSTANFYDARARKMDLDAKLSEIELAKAEGQLVPIDMYEKEMVAVFARVKAVLITIPSKYLGRIQVTRTELEAQAVGELIRDDLLTMLQGVGDDEGDEPGEVSDEAAA